MSGIIDRIIYIEINYDKHVCDIRDGYNRIIETRIKINRFTGKIKEDNSKLNMLVEWLSSNDVRIKTPDGELKDLTIENLQSPNCRCVVENYEK